MYGYVANHNNGQTLVTSEGRVYEWRESAGGASRWTLVEIIESNEDDGLAFGVEDFCAAATEEWGADWTEIDDEKIVEYLS